MQQALRRLPYGKESPQKRKQLPVQHQQQEEAEGQEKPKRQLPQHGAASSCTRWHQLEEEQEDKEEEEEEAYQLAGLHSGQEGMLEPFLACHFSMHQAERQNNGREAG